MTKRLKVLVLILCTAVFLFAVPVMASTPTEAKDSVVCIAIRDSRGSMIGWGSGFAIGKPGKDIQYIATNCHVAQPTDKYGNKIPCTLTVYFSAAAQRSMTAEVYWKSDEHDLAVLKLPEPTDQREAMVLCPMEKTDMDDDFAALGYPAASMAADVVKFDESDISITRGGISKQVRVNGTDCYLVDVEISQGNSGGPLVNSKGQVVGVNTFMIGEKAKYAVVIDELIRNLDQNQVPFAVAGSNVPQMVLIAGITAAVILVAVIILLVVKGKKKKQEPSPQIPEGHEIPPEPVASAPVPEHNSREASILVAGTGGKLANRKYRVTQATKIGRDSSKCGISFPIDTKGVSAVHCEVEPSGSGILLRDLNSTYGTFLGNGTKVEPGENRRLSSGDSFYLGGEDNRFEVR